MKKTYSTLTEAISALQAKGYEHDFNLHEECIECQKLDLRFGPEEFHVDEIHRFEGMTSPDDSDVLFAIRSNGGVKGLLVDAYGTYSDSISPEMLGKLRIDSQTKR